MKKKKSSLTGNSKSTSTPKKPSQRVRARATPVRCIASSLTQSSKATFQSLSSFIGPHPKVLSSKITSTKPQQLHLTTSHHHRHTLPFYSTLTNNLLHKPTPLSTQPLSWFSTGIQQNTMSETQKGLLIGKKIIITGASSGIGEASVADAINEGAQVVAIGRNEDKLKALKENTKCDYLVGDLTSPEDCKRMVDEAAKIMGGITSLVNCAGVLKGGAVGTADLNNFQFNFMNNTQSVWSMMEYTIPHLKLNDDGMSIVNISSVNGQQSFGGVAAYCAAKAAVDMLSKCAAVDLAPFKIRVNSICPGVVATNLQKTGGLSDEQYAGFIERSKTVTHPLAIPRGEVAQPQDVANLITFLVSDKSKWITGDNIKIDGGRACMGAR